jgi:hypothetical protein
MAAYVAVATPYWRDASRRGSWWVAYSCYRMTVVLMLVVAEWFRFLMTMDSKLHDFHFEFNFFIYLAYYDLLKLLFVIRLFQNSNVLCHFFLCAALVFIGCPYKSKCCVHFFMTPCPTPRLA